MGAAEARADMRYILLAGVLLWSAVACKGILFEPTNTVTVFICAGDTLLVTDTLQVCKGQSTAIDSILKEWP